MKELTRAEKRRRTEIEKYGGEEGYREAMQQRARHASQNVKNRQGFHTSKGADPKTAGKKGLESRYGKKAEEEEN